MIRSCNHLIRECQTTRLLDDERVIDVQFAINAKLIFDISMLDGSHAHFARDGFAISLLDYVSDLGA